MNTYYSAYAPLNPDTPFQTGSRLVVSALYGRKRATPDSTVESPFDVLSHERRKLENRPRNLNNPKDRRLCVTLLKIKIREEVAGLIGGLICSAVRTGWMPVPGFAAFPLPASATVSNHGSFGGYVHQVLEDKSLNCKECNDTVIRNMYHLGKLDLLVDGPSVCLCCLYQESADIIVKEWDSVRRIACELKNEPDLQDWGKVIEPLFNKALRGSGC